jgi:hypothetical protein
MKSEGHRRQVSAPTGPISDPTPKRAARSGIPPPPANRPHRHSDENTSDAHQPVDWQQVLRGGQAKPTKGATHVILFTEEMCLLWVICKM